MSITKQPRAVVTGGASGLGRAFCIALGQRGGRTLVADLDADGARATAEEVRAAGGEAEGVLCDVSQSDQVRALAALAEERFGGVDLLINNAGVGGSGSVGDISLQDWEWVIHINLWGVIYGCHHFVPLFRRQRAGHILNVASAAGLMSVPDLAPYNVTKAGVVALSETLHVELKRFGVGVTVLCPTFFRTNILGNGRFAAEKQEMTRAAAEFMEKSKIQAPDVARMALASCARNQLYCVPMADGRFGWWLKRIAPERFYRQIMPWVFDAARPRPHKV